MIRKRKRKRKEVEIEVEWQSTPQLYLAYRKHACWCEECRPLYGTGRTTEQAIQDLLEREASQ